MKTENYETNLEFSPILTPNTPRLNHIAFQPPKHPVCFRTLLAPFPGPYKPLDTRPNPAHYIRNGYISPLTPPVFHILLALADEDRHGYGIMQDVARQTGDALQMGPGTLYGCIKRMLAAGLIEEADERPDPELDDERRRYYRMTSLGRRTARAESERLAQALAAAKTKRVFSGGRA